MRGRQRSRRALGSIARMPHANSQHSPNGKSASCSNVSTACGRAEPLVPDASGFHGENRGRRLIAGRRFADRSLARSTPSLIFLSTIFLSTVGLPALAAGLRADELSYNQHVRPILADRCFACHGPDAAANDSGLRLDLAESATGELPGGNGAAIVPGKPEASELVRRILSDDPAERMPPADSHLSLSAEEAATLRQWVAEGAAYEPHWAFQSLPGQREPPADSSGWARNDIDRWVRADHIRAGVEPAEEAEPWRWLRRVTFDLTGLPPTPEEVAAFEADSSEASREQVVDRLLASPAFGEHMAVAWLDAARYADSFGYQSDLLCPTWPYRDWVVNAINADKSYDQFLVEQLAGDLLPGATRDQRLATAFNRLHRQTNEGGSISEEWRLEYAADRVHTLGTAILGLTLECARCHDHKFDPLTQRDYYSLLACFNSIDDAGTYLDGARIPTPSLPLPTPEQDAAIRLAEGELSAARSRLLRIESALLNGFGPWRSKSNELKFAAQPVACWPLDDVNDQKESPGLLSTDKVATLGAGNQLVPGRAGKAVQLGGDSASEFPAGVEGLEPGQIWSVAFRLWVPDGLDGGVVLHRQAGTDTGFYGTELVLADGRLRLSSIRFWPGDAISIETRSPVANESWISVAISNDGSGVASGLRLRVNGKEDCEIVRNRLYKAPGAGGTGFSLGARFRSTGIKGALVDHVTVFDRPLTAVEADLYSRDEVSIQQDRVPEKDAREHFLALSGEWLAERAAVAAAVRNVFAAREPVVETMVMEELPEPQATWVLARGAYDAAKSDAQRVQRGVPGCLPPLPEGAEADRLGIARWLVEENHPLTARVAVNRVWQGFFGRGLVETPQDFGIQGSYPGHPALLDGLARDFVESGWDFKWLCRQIALSATYRQTSNCSPERRETDPDNRLLARGPAGRLTAEMLRDTALAAGGLLDRTMGGPPVSPYQLPTLWTENNTMTNGWQQSTGRDLYRRSLYSVRKRTAPVPNMQVFDAPTREFCCVARSQTTTPLQALTLLNDVQFVEAMRALAVRAAANHPADVRGQITDMFMRLAGRSPTGPEADLLAETLVEQRAVFAADPAAASQLIQSGDSDPPADVDPVETAALTIVAQLILNSDATAWKR